MKCQKKTQSSDVISSSRLQNIMCAPRIISVVFIQIRLHLLHRLFSLLFKFIEVSHIHCILCQYFIFLLAFLPGIRYVSENQLCGRLAYSLLFSNVSLSVSQSSF